MGTRVALLKEMVMHHSVKHAAALSVVGLKFKSMDFSKSNKQTFLAVYLFTVYNFRDLQVLVFHHYLLLSSVPTFSEKGSFIKVY